jgi:NitT/TauT family transport system substrate-binding protein
MPFRVPVRMKRLLDSYAFRIFCAALCWLLLITFLHYYFNIEHEKRKTINMGYMPVITNLAAPLLDYASTIGNNDVRFRAVKFNSFAEMAEAFRNDKLQAAFIIAPLSIALFQQQKDVRIVYVGNRHESTLVIRQDLQINEFKDLDGRTIAVPIRYSGHNITLQRLIGSHGLENGIRVVEMNPPDMASALSAGSLDAYFVGEPFAAQTLMTGESKVLFYVEQIEPNFICNLLIVKEKLIKKEPDTVRMLVEGAARSGMWARQNRLEAAKIASQHWGQLESLVAYALNTPPDRIVFNQFVPDLMEMQVMADAMVHLGLIKSAGIDDLIDDRFARQSDLSAIGPSVTSIFKK